MDIHCIVNPASGDGRTEALWPSLERGLRAVGLSPVVQVSRSLSHVTDLAREAARKADGLVVCAGGDGTIAATLAALRGTGVSLGLFPTGTANDLARAVGIEPIYRRIGHPASRIRAAISTLIDGVDLDMGAIRLVGHWADGSPMTGWCFVECNAGLSSGTMQRKADGQLPWLPGWLRDIGLSLISLSPGSAPSVRLDLAPGDVCQGRLTALLAITMVETLAGGLRIAPGQRPWDNGFAVVAALDLTGWQTMRLAFAAMRGRHIGKFGVWMRSAQTLKLCREDGRSLIVNVDGEAHSVSDLQMTFVPDQVRLRVTKLGTDSRRVLGTAPTVSLPARSLPGL